MVAALCHDIVQYVVHRLVTVERDSLRGEITKMTIAELSLFIANSVKEEDEVKRIFSSLRFLGERFLRGRRAKEHPV